MNEKVCLYGGRLYDGNRMYERGGVLFDQKGIIDVWEGDSYPAASFSIDVEGRIIAPGLIDLHSDALEKCIEMRPGVYFDPLFALQNLDRRLAASGVTTIYHAVSFAEGHEGLRSCKRASELVRLLQDFAAAPSTLVHHHVHVRYEITSPSANEWVNPLVDEGRVEILSFMDHTPGQGQFRTLESYINYYVNTYAISIEEAKEVVAFKKGYWEEAQRPLKKLAQKAKSAGIPLLSHDDDTREKIAFIHDLGVTASEFPVSLEAAEAAKELGMMVFMGAPNFMRDRSTSGHLKASETLKAGLCDALVSDYYPEVMLQVPFIAESMHQMDLGEGFRPVTSGPAGFIPAKQKKGRLEPGAQADLVVIDGTGPWARVTQTWVSGKCRLRSDM